MLYETEGMVRFVGLDEAVVGMADVWEDSGEKRVRLIYAYGGIVDILMRDDKMTYEDAKEYIEFNVAGAYLGPGTPIILEEI